MVYRDRWGRLGETCNQYLAKGRQVYLEGRRSRSYEGRDGQTRFVNDINVTDVQFLGRGAGGEGDVAPYDSEPGAEDLVPATDDIDDLPF